MTIREALQQQTNDYSSHEKFFFTSTGHNLLQNHDFSAPPSTPKVTVVIPAFNAHNTILDVLSSINGQTYIEYGGQLQVILIDDHSEIPLKEVVNTRQWKFNLEIYRTDTTAGAGKARDIAIDLADGEIIAFIDADIIIQSSFISNHVTAHLNTPVPALFVSFRENIPDAGAASAYRKPDPRNGDHRIEMTFKEEWVMTDADKQLVGKKFNILKNTNGFKSLGNGNVHEQWTLPMMFLTCAASAPAKSVKIAHPTPEDLRGWGFNDTCLAAKMIADGLFLIPLNNSNVYHILEEKHTRSNDKKNREFLLNQKIYEKMLESEF